MSGIGTIIVDLEDDRGRILVSRLRKPVGRKTHCVEFHSVVEPGTFEVSFTLLTRDEVLSLRDAIAELTV